MKDRAVLTDAEIEAALSTLAAPNREFAEAYPGERSDRQPVHTVYGGADLFRSDSAAKLGSVALRSLDAYAPTASELFSALETESIDGEIAELVYERVVAKLRTEPVEDFRIDFEDGFGTRTDEEEDRYAVSAAEQVARGMEAGTLPPFIGIRLKPFTDEWAGRASRTLDLFLGTLLGETEGRLPPRFFVTNPKVVVPEQVGVLVDLFEAIERRSALEPGSLVMEIMIETPQSILGPDGRVMLLDLVEAARGRCVAAHFGVYDYTASVQITAQHQDLDHPACDFARHVMQVALSGTGVWLSDGATNVLPARVHKSGDQPLTAEQQTENRDAIHRAWRLHFRHVLHSLRHAYFQGWDLHPAQLPTRYAAVYLFFLRERESAIERLRNFVTQAARATLTGDVFDDAATGQALLNFFLRGVNCGAFDEDDIARTGLTVEEIGRRSFARIVADRREA